MAIFCNTEIMGALRNIRLPKNKDEILAHISDNNISEASGIALNKLENKTYYTSDEICKNIKIVCDIEIRTLLDNAVVRVHIGHTLFRCRPRWADNREDGVIPSQPRYCEGYSRGLTPPVESTGKAPLRGSKPKPGNLPRQPNLVNR